MTPAQMKRLLTPKREVVPIWERGPIVLIPDQTFTARELLFREENESLLRGKCPRCGSPVDAKLTAEDIRFACTKWPAFHDWKRSPSFITRD